jgi:hypothetical protein
MGTARPLVMTAARVSALVIPAVRHNTTSADPVTSRTWPRAERSSEVVRSTSPTWHSVIDQFWSSSVSVLGSVPRRTVPSRRRITHITTRAMIKIMDRMR